MGKHKFINSLKHHAPHWGEFGLFTVGIIIEANAIKLAEWAGADSFGLLLLHICGRAATIVAAFRFIARLLKFKR